MYRKGKVRCQPGLKWGVNSNLSLLPGFRFKTGILKTCQGRNLLRLEGVTKESQGSQNSTTCYTESWGVLFIVIDHGGGGA
jgi:hypothetical protein